MTSSKESAKGLYKVAYNQDGYFTAQQAKQAGYSQQSQSYHIGNGDWTREWRSIYRLNNYPRPDYPDLMILYLWTCNRQGIPQGVISHDMALDLYNLGSWSLQKNTITVMPDFRRNAPPPGGWDSIEIHRAKLHPADTKIIHHVPVTTPLKTIVDLLMAGHVPRHYLTSAVEDALNQGLITDRQLLQAELSPQERHSLTELFKDIDYDKGIKAIQNSSRLQASA
jgi:predicted transcriptional regulator of viral defense system